MQFYFSEVLPSFPRSSATAIKPFVVILSNHERFNFQ